MALLSTAPLRNHAMKPQPQNIILACQGGGSLTAFTAGVLQSILLELDPNRYRIHGLSGTSGGAICAALAWYGLLSDDPPLAVEKLQAFWDDNTASSPMDAGINAWLILAGQLAGSIALPQISPYDMPELARQQLLALLERHLPFAELAQKRKSNSPLLHIGAVNEASGAFKVFTGDDLSAEKLLASAAIPSLFRAVHISDAGHEGIYWDGLFSQNPPIREFVQPHRTATAKPDAIWIIRINPQATLEEPRTLQQIETRRNALAGNLSLNQELQFIEKVNDWTDKGWLPAERFKRIELLEIQLEVALTSISKFDRSPHWIAHLMTLGRNKGSEFLRRLQRT